MIALLLLPLLASATAPWSVETRPAILNATKSKSRPTNGTVTARDLEAEFRYPCVGAEDSGSEERAGEYATTPRFVLKDGAGNEVWMCTHAKAFRKIGEAHFRGLESFTIFLRDKKGKSQTLASEAEVMPRPYDVQVESEKVVLTKNLDLGKGRLIPFTKQDVSCSAGGCSVSRERCVLSAAGLDATKELKTFDDQIARFRKKPSAAAEPPLDLDRLMVLAATGNANARQRIEKYPLDIGGSAAGSEILGTYQMYLEEALKLGCGAR